MFHHAIGGDQRPGGGDERWDERLTGVQEIRRLTGDQEIKRTK